MKPKGLFISNPRFSQSVYGSEERKALRVLVDIPDRTFAPEEIQQTHRHLLSDVELIYSTWGGPRFDATFLGSVAQLKAVFYGAGSIKSIVTEEFWNRGILITSAAAANAVPVAEFAYAQVILSLKRMWWYMRETRRRGTWPNHEEANGWIPGTYGTTVGIFSLGMVGRLLLNKLKGSDTRVIAYDPYIDQKRANELDVELVSMEELFHRADVVTLHAPLLKETEGIITKSFLLAMKRNATFINTARGALIDEEDMIETLLARPDLFAVLDVTKAEPTEKGSLLYSLPNVVLTPHIGGSMNGECRRLGRLMIEETERYRKGQALRWGVTREMVRFSA